MLREKHSVSELTMIHDVLSWPFSSDTWGR